ncbi:MAG: AAA family ATPase [Candidatus Pelagibacter sp.]
MTLEPLNQINLISHSYFFSELRNLYIQDKLPNKILLSGEKGIGKSTIAYHLINYILSYNEQHPYNLKIFKINPENKFFKLTQNKSNPNFNLVDVSEDKKNIDISQIRNLISDLNKTSFNSKPRFVLIDNIELLNVNSVNALLKVLEEPNENIYFILINNNKKIYPTLRSRCINFNISLSNDQSIEIINKILNVNIFSLLNKELISNYSTPGQLFALINFGKQFDIDLKNINLKELLSLIINKKYFQKENKYKYLIYFLIELYFRNNISVKNIKLTNIYNYFLKKINNTKKFNLDEETLFMEFEESILNG